MSNSIQTKKAFVLNSIPNQTLSYANQLTTQQWNTIINTLSKQTNDTTKYLKDLHQWLIGYNNTADTLDLDEVSFYDYIMNVFESINSKFPNYYTKTESDNLLNVKANASDIPTKVSELTNDSGYALKTELFSKSYNDLTDRPTIPTTISQLTNDSGYATNDSVDTKIANLVNSAPEALDTLGELAVALEAHEDAYDALLETVGSKANSSDVYTKTESDLLLENKVDKVDGYGLSENDLTDRLLQELKDKYTKEEVDNIINSCSIPVILEYEGNLPTSSSSTAITILSYEEAQITNTIKWEVPEDCRVLFYYEGDIVTIPNYVTFQKGTYYLNKSFDYPLQYDEGVSVHDGTTFITTIFVGSQYYNLAVCVHDDNINRIEILPIQSLLIDRITIKTINGQEILGSGNIEIESGVDSEEITNILSAYATKEELEEATGTDMSIYALKTELFSKSYNDLTDRPTIPTATSQLTNDSDYATNESVNTKIATLVNSAPETLDTLGELAQAIQENETVVEALNSAIGNKANASDVYTKTESDSTTEAIYQKIDEVQNSTELSNYYTKTESDNLLNDKANVSDVYTISQVDDLLDDLPITDLGEITVRETDPSCEELNAVTTPGIYKFTFETVPHLMRVHEAGNGSIVQQYIYNGIQVTVRLFMASKWTISSKTLATTDDLPRTISELINDSGYATNDSVDTKIANLVNSAPEALDTLGELAVALEAHEDAYDALLETVGSKANASDIPTKTSQLTNDSNYVIHNQEAVVVKSSSDYASEIIIKAGDYQVLKGTHVYAANVTLGNTTQETNVYGSNVSISSSNKMNIKTLSSNNKISLSSGDDNIITGGGADYTTIGNTVNPTKITGNFIALNYVKTITAPTASDESTYGAGSSGQALMSNGANVYWGDILTKDDIPIKDLGEISSIPNENCQELSEVKTAGIYKFTYNSIHYLMYVTVFTSYIRQYYSDGSTTLHTRTYTISSDTWAYGTTSLNATTARNYAASGNTSSKIYLIGRTSQSSTGGVTYSHDTAYVDGSGRLCGTAGVYSNKFYAPTTSGGTSYGVGSSGRVLMSNGSTTYWGTPKLYEHVISLYDYYVDDTEYNKTVFTFISSHNITPTTFTEVLNMVRSMTSDKEGIQSIYDSSEWGSSEGCIVIGNTTAGKSIYSKFYNYDSESFSGVHYTSSNTVKITHISMEV